MKILIAVASKHGSTREVAERISTKLRDAGHETLCLPAAEVTSIDDYQAVLLGSGIYAGSWLREATAFVDRFKTQAADKPVWTFSCGPVGDPLAPSGRPKSADASAAKLGALEHRIFPGVVDRSDYSLVEKGIMGALKVPDGDYRSWPEVDEWAEGLVTELASK